MPLVGSPLNMILKQPYTYWKIQLLKTEDKKYKNGHTDGQRDVQAHPNRGVASQVLKRYVDYIPKT